MILLAYLTVVILWLGVLSPLGYVAVLAHDWITERKA